MTVIRFLSLIFNVTDALSPPGIKDDPGIHIILSGLELCKERLRNGESNVMVRRKCDTAGLNIVSCNYSGMLADVAPRILVEIVPNFRQDLLHTYSTVKIKARC